MQAEILAEVPAHAFGEKLLPTVAVSGHGGVGILFLERWRLKGFLLISVVDAGRGGIEIAGHAVF